MVPTAARTPRAAAVLLALLAVVLGLVHASPARAAEPPAAPAPGAPHLGAVLDWSEDSAAAHAQRLGAPAAVYGRPVPLPMGPREQGHLRDYFGQVAAQGAQALLTVRPGVPLAEVDDARAAALAAQVADAAQGYDGTVMIRFAPQMNASWVDWGQQPEAYRTAFRAVAAAVDAELAGAVLVWSPTAARDYPFRAPSGTAPSGGALGDLDTDGSGVWDVDDDAYAPYYPGDDVVDWVGLTVQHDETGEGPARNTVPEPGSFCAALGPSSPDVPAGAEDFYAAYAVGRDKPLLVETAAFYSPGAAGAGEERIKRAWAEQVLAAPAEGYDRIGALVWTETAERREDGPVVVDWRITHEPGLAGAFARQVADSAAVTGPVVAASALEGTAPAATGVTLTGPAAWAAAAAALAAVLVLCLLPRARPVRQLGYADTGARDARIDMLRGAAIVFVVVNHVGLTSLFQLLTQESVGAVSGAELFVLLSGAVLGLVHGPRARDGLGEVVDRTSGRAWKLYVTALVVVLIVLLLSRLPFLDASAVTTFTDQGTGAAGAAAAGATYDLYAGMDGLFRFPVPAHLVPALLLLQVGPWQFNIMGLYVVLLALSPLVLAALARGRTWVVVLASVSLYAVGTTTRWRLLPSQFEDSFPLLVWQVLFVLGTVAGYHRARIVAWFSAPRRRPLLTACVLLAAVLAVFSWTGPYFTNAYDVRLALLPEEVFRSVYDALFQRTYLGPGRLLNVLLVVVAAYALLTAYWRPLHRGLGWFLLPLGRASLYVFVVHVFLVLAAANVPALRQGDVWLNTAAYAVVLALLWLMVRTRFLFRLIPR